MQIGSIVHCYDFDYRVVSIFDGGHVQAGEQRRKLFRAARVDGTDEMIEDAISHYQWDDDNVWRWTPEYAAAQAEADRLAAEDEAADERRRQERLEREFRETAQAEYDQQHPELPAMPLP